MSSTTNYELIYWPGMPGRGEHIRLVFEEAGVAYKDHASDPGVAVAAVMGEIAETNVGDAASPPSLAPPILKASSPDGSDSIVLAQTSAIVLFLAPRLGLAPANDPVAIAHINQLVLTALDGLSNEVHDTHHPIATGLYYEDQKEEAKKRAKDFLENRLPKFLGYFERVLKGEKSGDGPWLYTGKLTVADLVLFQCVDGVKHAFPKAMAKLEVSGNYRRVFELYKAVKERPNIKKYLESDRRQKYALGIYRHYPELDAE